MEQSGRESSRTRHASFVWKRDFQSPLRPPSWWVGRSVVLVGSPACPRDVPFAVLSVSLGRDDGCVCVCARDGQAQGRRKKRVVGRGVICFLIDLTNRDDVTTSECPPMGQVLGFPRREEEVRQRKERSGTDVFKEWGSLHEPQRVGG
jgi:hypothetical protein